MLKGHLQIDLHNEITGEDKRIEQDNMVTNALGYLLGLAANAGGKGTNMFDDLLPAATKALGGLFLFDGTLTEDVNNVHFPMSVHLTGHAGQSANTASKLGGSINTAESGRTDTGYVNVWDFSTSQANGTIASLALTHTKGGENPFTGAQYSEGSYSSDRYYCPLTFDESTGNLYVYSEGKIYKKRIYTNIVRAYTPYFGEEEQVFDFAFSNPSYSSWAVMDGYDGHLYAVYVPYVSSQGTVSVRIRKLKISDFSFEEETEQTIAVSNVTSKNTGSTDYYEQMNAVVSSGCLYFISYDESTLYKVDLANTVDVQEINFGSIRCKKIFPMRGGGVFAIFEWSGTTSSGSTTTYGSPGIVYPDKKYRLNAESTGGVGTPENYISHETSYLQRFQMYRSNMYHSFACNYLGTICNLSSPVVKTSAQSMKVTYTLTDAV
ncbi:hypothetical protein ACTNE3_07905 [Bacillota bacterium HCP3S3_F1_1]|jgi:hypothetical protein